MVIFDDCVVNFGNVVKYRFNYESQGRVLKMQRVEILKHTEEQPEPIREIQTG